MSRFYGVVRGAARTEATRRGYKFIRAIAASWQGAVSAKIAPCDDDPSRDCAHVYLVTWPGESTVRTLYHGPVDGTVITYDDD